MAPSDSQKPVQFATTQWSMVVAAGHRSTSVSKKALNELCETYWYPIYAFIRRKGYAREKSEDLTQSFLARLIENRSIAGISPEGGRFRSYLLKSITNFLNNAHKFESAQKRGGLHKILSLDFEQGELSFSQNAQTRESPASLFERQWAMAVLKHARARLQADYAGDPQRFVVLAPWLDGTAESTQAAAAHELGLSESAFKTSVHRLRKKFGECLRAAIRDTVDSDEEVNEELAYLMKVFRG